MKKSIIITFAAMMLMCSCSHDKLPITSIEQGKISGIVENGVNVFKGIPYAQAPVGDLRWRRPQAPLAWAADSVRSCDSWGAAAPQARLPEGSFYWKEFYSSDGEQQFNEDCLYLNVWTPNLEAHDLPVIVWIHGGSFDHGYGNEIEFSGEALARKGVILVTINYRVGILGFLSHPLLAAEDPDGITGDYGLYDQIAAIEWVKRNIAAFGGNPDNITIMGQSAGAGSVQALISSPLTKDLVKKAIIHSGGGYEGLIPTRSGADDLALGEGYFPDSLYASVDDMRAVEVEKLPEIVANYLASHDVSWLPFMPAVNGHLLPASFEETIDSGSQLDIPYIIGFTKEDFNADIMLKSAVTFADKLNNQQRKSVYIYSFDRDLPGDENSDLPDNMPGAFHSSELWYVFGTLNRCWRPMTEQDYQLSDRMTTMWANFARDGKPAEDDAQDAWPAYTNENQYIKHFDIEQ